MWYTANLQKIGELKMDVTAEQLFERTILHELLNNKEYFSKAFSILKPDYFTDNRKDIYNLIKQHYNEHKEPGCTQDVAIQIKNLQNQDHKLQIVNEIKEVAKQESPNLQAMLEETLKFVKDSLYLQALEIGSEGLMTKSDKLKLKAEQILEERAKINLDSDLGIEFTDEDILNYYESEINGLLTQHKSLNFRLGPGFLEGTLSIFVAPSGIGKSLLMTDLVSGWIQEGKNVLMVSLEMSAKEVMKRVHANTLNIPIVDLAPGKFNREQFKAKLKESKEKGHGTFYSKDYPALSFGSLQLDALIAAYKNEKGIDFDVVLVDYLGIMKSDLISPSAGLYSYVKSIAEELRSVFVRRGIAGVTVSQANRSATNNLDADNAAVSDSYGTLMTADFLMFLLQTEDMKATGDIIFKITKNRFAGMTESFPMKVDYTYMRFGDPQQLQSFAGDMNQIAFMEQFEINKKATDQQHREIVVQDAINAKKFDDANKVYLDPTVVSIPGTPPVEGTAEVNSTEKKTMDDLLSDLF